jgi:hypothetical protein
VIFLAPHGLFPSLAERGKASLSSVSSRPTPLHHPANSPSFPPTHHSLPSPPSTFLCRCEVRSQPAPISIFLLSFGAPFLLDIALSCPPTSGPPALLQGNVTRSFALTTASTNSSLSPPPSTNAPVKTVTTQSRRIGHGAFLSRRSSAAKLNLNHRHLKLAQPPPALTTSLLLHIGGRARRRQLTIPDAAAASVRIDSHPSVFQSYVSVLLLALLAHMQSIYRTTVDSGGQGTKPIKPQ